MSTKPAPEVNEFPADSLEKKVYSFVDELAEYIPVINDRYRLSYGIVKYLEGSGDSPETLVTSTKVDYKGISKDDLVKKLNEGIEKIK